jgi:hypothetical protein
MGYFCSNSSVRHYGCSMEAASVWSVESAVTYGLRLATDKRIGVPANRLPDVSGIGV